jgi:hypothetical protein
MRLSLPSTHHHHSVGIFRRPGLADASLQAFLPHPVAAWNHGDLTRFLVWEYDEYKSSTK